MREIRNNCGKHCEDCEHFKFKPGKRRGICNTRPKEQTSALYASGKICNRFVERN